MELPYTHKLNHPVKHGEETITELVFKRRPVGKDSRGIQITKLDDGNTLVPLVARLTNNPPSLIDNLDLEDLLTVGGLLGDFFQIGRTTGSKPAE